MGGPEREAGIPVRAAAAKAEGESPCNGAAASSDPLPASGSPHGTTPASAGTRRPLPPPPPRERTWTAPPGGTPRPRRHHRARSRPPTTTLSAPQSPGLQASAIEIGDVDYSNCTNSLDDFLAEAGQADGESTAIALASDNPGYNPEQVPAPPLKHVIESAGPGCG